MPEIDVRQFNIIIDPRGQIAQLTVRGALDLEPTVIRLPYAILEAAVAQHMGRRAAATLQQMQRAAAPLVGPDGVSPAAGTGG